MNQSEHAADLEISDHFKRQIESYERARSECAKHLVQNPRDNLAANRALSIQNEGINLIRAHRAKDMSYYFPDL